MKRSSLSIGELSRRTGVPVKTLRFWSDEGLISPRSRSENFYERVSEGIPIDAEWRKRMIEASSPSLPDNPTPEQLDAWVELAELVADPAFVESLRANAREVWDNQVDMSKLRAANDEAARAASSLRARGIGPESKEARDLVFAFVDGIAAASGKANDEKLRHGVRDRFARQDPRATRYWELVSTMTGRPHPQVGTPDDWKLIAQAVKLHF